MTWKELKVRLYIIISLQMLLFGVWFAEEAYFNTFRPFTAIMWAISVISNWRLLRAIWRMDKRVGL